MAENFEERVKKLFGSQLYDSVPANSFSSSSWSVAAGEVERRSWNRGGGSAGGGGPDDRENDPCASAFDDDDGCFGRKARIGTKQRWKNDWEGGVDDEEEDDEEGGRGNDYEERDEVRASVGLDPTLDREEEEDEYDRRAFNKENTGDRVFMREIMDHGPYLNIHSVVPDSLDDTHDEIHDFSKDPRADHFAATVRLNQDKSSEDNGHHVIAGFHEDSSMLHQTSITDNNVKPILKRKESPVESKTKKRVRFDPGCIGDHLKDIEEAKDVPMEISSVREETSCLPAKSSGIPDYLKNPTRYTCYTLSPSDKDDDESNKQRFNDFHQMVKKSDLDQHESSSEIPKSIIFTSRKNKAQDAMMLDDSTSDICCDEPHKQVSQLAACTIAIAAGGNDECEMEDDETLCKEFNGQRANIITSRKYRSKPASDNST